MTPLAEYTRPSPDMAAEAAEAARSLAPFLRKRKGAPQHLTVVAKGDQDTRVTVPRAAFELFVRILGEMARGRDLPPEHAEERRAARIEFEHIFASHRLRLAGPQQAADLLNVSRPFMVKLLEEQKIPCRMVGTRRRVRFEDLVRYKQQDEAERQNVLDELTAEAQRLGLDY